MKLNITNNANIQPDKDGTYLSIGALGGTELSLLRLKQYADSNLLDKFNIICSRVRPGSIDPTKKNILWCTDTWDDPESQHLKDPKSRARFTKLVFASNYQQSTYNMGLGVPYDEGVVLQNAIEPIEVTDEDKTLDKIRLIYHTTPHRGLEILVPVFEKLCELHKNIHLDVYSSFKIYGWEQRDKQYESVFKRIIDHPNMTYHGYQPNDVVRDALKKAHIFAYPNIWPETSCISVIEAMSAKCHVVTSNLAALPETCANFAAMYNYHDDVNKHANLFANVLNMSIHEINDEQMQHKLTFQKMYFDNYYSWDLRKLQWNAFLSSLL